MINVEKLHEEFINLVSNGAPFSNETLIKSANLCECKISFLQHKYPHLLTDFLAEIITSKLCEINPDEYLNIPSFTDRVSKISQNFLDSIYINEKYAGKMVKFYIKKPTCGANILYKISSELMKIAQDSSLDFSFYTKRAILFGIFTSLLPDILRHKNIENIKQNLHNRIQSTRKIAKIKEKFGKFF